jgi:polysaccharide export outer membrane protein
MKTILLRVLRSVRGSRAGGSALTLALAPVMLACRIAGVQISGLVAVGAIMLAPVIAAAEAPRAEAQNVSDGFGASAPAAPQMRTDAPLSTSAEAEYVLGSQDRVRLIVFGEQALSGEFSIDASGRIALPLIGEAQAQGLTPRQLEGAIEAALRQGYLNDPRVSIEVLTYRPFYILGEVREPGELAYSTGLTALNAVARAGGFTPLADQRRVYIKRAGSETEVELALGPSALVLPGDTVRISKGAFYILGEVNAPGEYAFSDGMTLQNAVAMAGGWTYRANKNRIFIKRKGEIAERALKVTPDLVVQPGDAIRVAERFF